MTRDEYRTKLIDLAMHMHVETERAVLISDDGKKDNAVWLPKSQIEIEFFPTMKNRGNGPCIVTLPEWLAMDKGLI